MELFDSKMLSEKRKRRAQWLRDVRELSKIWNPSILDEITEAVEDSAQLYELKEILRGIYMLMSTVEELKIFKPGSERLAVLRMIPGDLKSDFSLRDIHLLLKTEKFEGLLIENSSES